MRTDPLTEWLAGCPVTSVTAGNTVAVTPEPAPALNVTPVTSQKRAAAKYTMPALNPEQIAALESMEADTAARNAGKAPEGDTATMICAGCGVVYVHPSIASVLPTVEGWPRALGCMWRAIRKAGKYVPRPKVTCENCRHFTPDTVNSAAGMGSCTSGHGMHYPMKAHRCGDFQPEQGPTP